VFPPSGQANDVENFIGILTLDVEASIEKSRWEFIQLVIEKYGSLPASTQAKWEVATFMQAYLDAFDTEVAILDEKVISDLRNYVENGLSEMSLEEVQTESKARVAILVKNLFDPQVLFHTLENKVLLALQLTFEESTGLVTTPLTGTQTNPIAAAPETAKKEFCGHCGKKAYLMLDCKCGGYYCLKHLDFLKHKCTFDYQGEAREQLKKQNPKVVASKVDSI
jgi:hypothetical protein